jgi:MFS family permease
MAKQRDGRTAVIRNALTNNRLRRVLFAYLMFNICEWAVYLTLLVWAYGEGGVRGSSLIAALQLIPSAMFASLLSTLLLRFSRGMALLMGYAVQTVAMLGLATVLLLELPFGAVAPVAMVAAVAVTLTRPAHHALMPEISETTADLTAGNAASGSVEAAATFLGPLSSGFLLAAWSPGGAVLVMGVASAVSAGVVAGLGGLRRPTASRPARASSSVLLVGRDPVARLLCALVAAEYVLVGMMDILLVVLALDFLEMSEAGPGLLNSALGVGGIVGALFTVVLIGRARMAPFVVFGAVVAGIPFTLAGVVGGPVPALVVVAACGAGKVFFDVANRTFVARLLPDRLLTAVFGTQESLMMAGVAVGTLLAPLLVALLGGPWAFAVAGVFLPVVAVGAAGRLRRLDQATAVPQQVLTLLRGVPLLAVLAPRVVERLAMETVLTQFSAGEVVIAEGAPGDRFYVVAAGRAEVTQAGAYVRELGPGSWFGELALLRDTPRTATVTAATELELLVVERDAFLASVGLSAPSRAVADDHARDHYR